MVNPNLSSQRKTIAIVWLTVFIDLVGFSIIFPLFPAMLEWYLPREAAGSPLHSLVEGLTRLTTGTNQDFLVTVLFGGILGSLYSLLQFVASPVWGRLSDRYGRRPVLLVTTLGTALSYIVWIFAGGFWVLILSRLLGGIMAGNIAVATASIADLTESRNRSRGMALIGVAFGLGFILGPAIGGLGSLVEIGALPENAGAFSLNPFSFPAAIAFLLAVFNFVWVWRRFPETHEPEEPTTAPAEPLIRFGSSIPDIRRALWVYFLFIFAFSGMEFSLTFLALERLLYEPHDMTLIFVFIGIVLALTQGYAVRKYGQRLGECNFTTFGLLCGAVSLVCLSVSHAPGLFYTGLALLGIGVGCVTPSLSALVSLYAPDKRQGRELGAFRSTGALGRAIGPLFGAGLFWWMGSQVAYIAGGVLLFIAGLFSLLLPRPRHSSGG